MITALHVVDKVIEFCLSLLVLGVSKVNSFSRRHDFDFLLQLLFKFLLGSNRCCLLELISKSIFLFFYPLLREDFRYFSYYNIFFLYNLLSSFKAIRLNLLVCHKRKRWLLIPVNFYCRHLYVLTIVYLINFRRHTAD